MNNRSSRPALRLLLLTAVALGGCQAPPAGLPSEAETKVMEERVQAYFSRAVAVAPGVAIRLRDMRASSVPGLLNATLELVRSGQVQRLPLTLSRDGRFMVQGEVIDLAIDPEKAVIEKIALAGVPVRGNPEAPVTIVAYSDFQCPFCARAYQTIEAQVLTAYPDKVRLVFKQYPLASIHPWAEPAALATACARQQGPQAFWLLYDFFFQNQAAITVANVRDKAEAAIRAGGFDGARFADCYDAKLALPSVRADMDEAAALGVKSTPTFFINGRRMEGAVPFESVRAVIDEQLRGG